MNSPFHWPASSPLITQPKNLTSQAHPLSYTHVSTTNTISITYTNQFPPFSSGLNDAWPQTADNEQGEGEVLFQKKQKKKEKIEGPPTTNDEE